MRFRVIDAMQITPHRQHLCPLRHQTWRAFFRVVVSSGIRDDYGLYEATWYLDRDPIRTLLRTQT